MPDKVNMAMLYLWVFVFCHGAALCNSVVPPQRDDRDSDTVASSMMRYYAFAFCNPTSDVLIIDIKRERKEYMAYWYGINRIRTFAKVHIWWPGLRRDSIKNPEILERCVFSVLGGSRYGDSYNHDPLDRITYQRFLHLKGMKDRKATRDFEYEKRIGEIEAASEDNPIPRLIEAQGAAFQDTKYNAMILDRLKALYPVLPRAWGVYLEYWDCPWSWHFQ